MPTHWIIFNESWIVLKYSETNNFVHSVFARKFRPVPTVIQPEVDLNWNSENSSDGHYSSCALIAYSQSASLIIKYVQCLLHRHTEDEELATLRVREHPLNTLHSLASKAPPQNETKAQGNSFKTDTWWLQFILALHVGKTAVISRLALSWATTGVKASLCVSTTLHLRRVCVNFAAIWDILVPNSPCPWICRCVCHGCQHERRQAPAGGW